MPHTRSSLCNARIEYAPKLPLALREGLKNIIAKKGEPTESIADQDKIKGLFPNTYGAPVVTFEKGDAGEVKPIRVETIRIEMDVNIKLQKDLQEMFAFEKELQETQPDGDSPKNGT